MLEQIQKFSNSEVFSVTLENEPEKTKHWFRATDLCDVLFTKGNAQRYVTLHCKEWQYREFQVGKGRPALYVCESGVYRLILRSKAPIALEFQDWLTEDVLPKLRASGGYIMPTATSKQLEALQAEINRLQSEIEVWEEDRQLRKETYNMMTFGVKFSNDVVDSIMKTINHAPPELLRQFHEEMYKFINNDPIYDHRRFGRRKLSKDKFARRWKAEFYTIAS